MAKKRRAELKKAYNAAFIAKSMEEGANLPLSKSSSATWDAKVREAQQAKLGIRTKLVLEDAVKDARKKRGEFLDAVNNGLRRYPFTYIFDNLSCLPISASCCQSCMVLKSFYVAHTLIADPVGRRRASRTESDIYLFRFWTPTLFLANIASVCQPVPAS